jgi:hypothetical protein
VSFIDRANLLGGGEAAFHPSRFDVYLKVSVMDHVLATDA